MGFRCTLFNIVGESCLADSTGSREVRERDQHDSEEFLQFTLDKLDWHPIQVRSHRQEIDPPAGVKVAESDGAIESHIHLAISIDNVHSLQDAVDGHFSPERMAVGGGKVDPWVLPNGRIVPVWLQSQQIVTLPTFLILQLKRFTFANKIAKKIDKAIEFPADKKIRVHNNWYQIVGCINHAGPTPKSGHYTTDIRAEDDQFYHCDDAAVRCCSDDSIAYWSSNAYLIVLKNLNKTDQKIVKSRERINAIHNIIRDGSSRNILTAINNPTDQMAWYHSGCSAYMRSILQSDVLDVLKGAFCANLNLLRSVRNLGETSVIPREDMLRIHADSIQLYVDQMAMIRGWQNTILEQARLAQRDLLELRDLILGCGALLDVVSPEFLKRCNDIARDKFERARALPEQFTITSVTYLERLLALQHRITEHLGRIPIQTQADEFSASALYGLYSAESTTASRITNAERQIECIAQSFNTDPLQNITNVPDVVDYLSVLFEIIFNTHALFVQCQSQIFNNSTCV